MDKLNKYGDTRTADYYGGGTRCLLFKVKKQMFTMNNIVRVTFRVTSNGTKSLKNDYFLGVKGSEVYFQNLEKRTNIKCFCNQDNNYVYVYSATPEYGYNIITQILSATDYSIAHIDFTPFEKWSDTTLGTNVVTSYISNETPTTVTFTFANAWEHHTTSNYSYVRQIDDIVYVNLTVKNGDVTDYKDIVTGLPTRETTEPTLLYPVTYKDGANASYKMGYCRLTTDGKLQILGVTSNTMLIVAFQYKREISF